MYTACSSIYGLPSASSGGLDDSGLVYMRVFRFFRLAGLFLVSVLAAAVAGTLVQTQINLADIEALGAPVSAGGRLATTGADLLGFTPTLIALSIPALLLALPMAAALARGMQSTGRALVFALAGWAALMAAFTVADAAAPMPTLIAATREFLGAAAVAGGGAIGGAVFALLTRKPAERSSVTGGAR